MIGVFDSGLGGMQTLQYLRTALPAYDFLYLGDTLFVPYGTRSEKWICARSFQCLERLFAQGCVLVIMACNTASAYALRKRQVQFPHRKVLSVTVPGVEALIAGGHHRPLLLGTQVTIQSTLYESVCQKAFPAWKIDRSVQIGYGRVDALEAGKTGDVLHTLLATAGLDRFLGKVDSVVLGCTHYPLLHKSLSLILTDLPLIDPAYEAAHKLPAYLARHADLELACTKQATTYLSVTGDSELFTERISSLWGVREAVNRVVIDV